MMKGFEKYSELFISKAKELIAQNDLLNNPEYQEAFKNHLFGLSGPRQMARELTPPDIFFSKIYNGFQEISDSYYCLLDIEIYISRFPYTKTRISKTRHLTYHMENYLNEVYILKERLKSYFTKIGRLYKDDPGQKTILKKTRPLFIVVNEALKGIIETRGSHVHQTRFYGEDLDRLRSQEFLSDHGGDELIFIKNYFKFEHRIIKSKYKQIIKNNNKQIRILLDGCFDILYEIVADRNGKIKYPQTIKA
jgi:hypothetical protein